MEPDFWLQTWKNDDLGFHRSKTNPALVKSFNKLSVPKKSRVFLPLCGKTRDIDWLLAEDYDVAGAELSATAVKQLFDRLKMDPTITQMGDIERYSAKNIDIFVGNIFDLSGDILGSIDAIYDRAALVALPHKMRKQYTAHLKELTKEAPQLLMTFEYDQTVMEGPPFSISPAELNQHYGNTYNLSLIERTDVKGGLKGKYAAKKSTWLLKK